MYGFTPRPTIESSTGRRPRTGRALRNAWLLTEVGERRAVDARQRHLGQHPVDDEDPEDEEDPAPDVGRAERVEQGLEHGRLRRPCRAWRWRGGLRARVLRSRLVFVGFGRRGRGFGCGAGGIGLGCLGGSARFGAARAASGVASARRARLREASAWPASARRFGARLPRLRCDLGCGAASASCAASAPTAGRALGARTGRSRRQLRSSMRALAVNASAATNSGGRQSPWPRILTGLIARPIRPADASAPGLTVTGAAPFLGFRARRLAATRSGRRRRTRRCGRR